MFSFSIPTLSIILFSLSAACIALIVLLYCRPLYLLRRRRIEQSVADATSQDSLWPMASIVIYARNEAEALRKSLPLILEQDYPGRFEVIVVNDGASPETAMAVGEFKLKYPNLYLTYTPEGVRSLSRKKLAITIGVKAAKGDVVLISEAAAIPASDQWLKRMMRHFTDAAVHVVMGHGDLATPTRRTYARLNNAFDLLADNCIWQISAIKGKPYRACGYNLAYRKDLFFQNKGFSSSLNMRHGEDDIFVSEIANADNSVVELSSEAAMTLEAYPYRKSAREWRASHAFTGRKLSKCLRRIMAASEWLGYAAIGCSIAGAIIAGWQNIFGWALALVTTLGVLLMMGISWRYTARAFHTPSVGVFLPFQALTRPLRNSLASMRARSRHAAHYTWQ